VAVGTITQTLTMALDPDDPGYLGVTLSYEIPSAVEELTVSLPNTVEEIRSQDFRVRGRTCRWTAGDGGDRPTITARLDANHGSARAGYGFVDTGGWAIVRTPNVGLGWQYRGADPGVSRRYDLADPGAVSDDGSVAYLGPHDEYTRTAAKTGERFRLIVPAAATLSATPEAVLTALTGAAELLSIGAENDTVLAIAAPTGDVDWLAKGRQRGDDGFWVRDTAVPDEVNETWVHEYVHTRQVFHYTDTTHWLTEGSADYFAGLAAVHRGDIDFGTFHRFHTRDRDEETVLADPSTWASGATKYHQGRRACAALDVRIRRTTNGRRSLADVVAHLNDTFGRDDTGEIHELTHRELVDAVDAVVDERFDGWFERVVWGTQTPDVPDDPTAYGLTTASDGGSVDTSTPDTDPGPGSGPGPGPSPGRDPGGDRPEPDPTDAERSDGDGPETDGESVEGGEAPADRTCPVCGTGSDGSFCPECGFELTPTCPVCGETGEPDVEYCTTCGMELRGDLHDPA
jgi:hypothetical protein